MSCRRSVMNRWRNLVSKPPRKVIYVPQKTHEHRPLAKRASAPVTAVGESVESQSVNPKAMLIAGASSKLLRVELAPVFSAKRPKHQPELRVGLR
jgi:hypothetical protein